MDYIDYTYLSKINFPIFALPKGRGELTAQDGIVRMGGFVLDDRTQIGANIGARRLQTPHPLQRLRKCYEGIPELLKSKEKIFIDNLGYVFNYSRTKFTKVQYHKILRVVQKDSASLLVLSGTSFPVQIKRPPPLGYTWVGMLYLDGKPWIPYEYSMTRCADKRRKI